MFDIGFDRRGRDGDALGEVTIGAHRETFIADLSYWSAEDYAASWLRSAARVLEYGHGHFLVSVTAPGQSSYTLWACRAHEGEAHLVKALLPPSLTLGYRDPIEAENMQAVRDNDEANAVIRRCSLRDIADFETRSRHASAH